MNKLKIFVLVSVGKLFCLYMIDNYNVFKKY